MVCDKCITHGRCNKVGLMSELRCVFLAACVGLYAIYDP